MTQPLLRAEGISKAFAGVQALKNVSLEIAPGEIHCLAGENGCGKSTLIKIISGVYQQDAGFIEFAGKQYKKITPREAINSGIQVIYQDFSVFHNLTVMENLALNSELAEGHKFVNRKRMKKTAEEAIAKINFRVDLDRLVGTLSVAEKQLVAICRALMFNARLIIMDEPTTALTRKEVQALFQIILKLKEQGISTLFVSHKLNEVFEISERFTILRSGELVVSGSTADLDDKKFSYYMTGRKFEKKSFVPQHISDSPVLEAQSLSLSGCYEDVSFQLRSGEILGITGLLDSGRTELALSLFGIQRADSGTLLKDGKPIRLKSPEDAITHRIGYVPEDRLNEGLFLPRTIADNIIISEIDHLANKTHVIQRDKRQQEVNRWVKELTIATPNADNACSTLSGGNQQRIVLAKWLACNLDVLVLNGPTVGVDIGSKHDIHAILQALADEGMGIIIISDDLPEMLVNCSSLLVLKNGRVAAMLKPGESTEQSVLSYML